MTPQPASLAIFTASMDSVTVPIWFTCPRQTSNTQRQGQPRRFVDPAGSRRQLSQDGGGRDRVQTQAHKGVPSAAARCTTSPQSPWRRAPGSSPAGRRRPLGTRRRHPPSSCCTSTSRPGGNTDTWQANHSLATRTTKLQAVTPTFTTTHAGTHTTHTRKIHT